MLGSFGKIFQRALSEDEADIGFYAIRTMTHLVPHIGTDDLQHFQPLISQVIVTIQKLITVDTDKATEAMEIFDELFEAEVAIVVPHIKPIVELCLQVGAAEELDDSIRAKSIAFLGRVTKYLTEISMSN